MGLGLLLSYLYAAMRAIQAECNTVRLPTVQVLDFHRHQSSQR